MLSPLLQQWPPNVPHVIFYLLNAHQHFNNTHFAERRQCVYLDGTAWREESTAWERKGHKDYSSKHMERLKKEKEIEAYNTCCTQAVTHPSTERAQHCLKMHMTFHLLEFKESCCCKLGSKFREKLRSSTHVAFTVCMYNIYRESCLHLCCFWVQWLCMPRKLEGRCFDKRCNKINGWEWGGGGRVRMRWRVRVRWWGRVMVRSKSRRSDTWQIINYTGHRLNFVVFYELNSRGCLWSVDTG